MRFSRKRLEKLGAPDRLQLCLTPDRLDFYATYASLATFERSIKSQRFRFISCLSSNIFHPSRSFRWDGKCWFIGTDCCAFLSSSYQFNSPFSSVTQDFPCPQLIFPQLLNMRFQVSGFEIYIHIWMANFTLGTMLQ